MIEIGRNNNDQQKSFQRRKCVLVGANTSMHTPGATFNDSSCGKSKVKSRTFRRGSVMVAVYLGALFCLSGQYCSSQCDPVGTTTCSYTGLNGNCTIYIDRATPAAPPTTYARHGSIVTVSVVNLSPFEQLSMDFSSAKAVIPTDSFQAFMSGQSGTLQKLSIIDLSQGRDVSLLSTSGPGDELTAISKKQSSIYSAYDLSTFFPVLAQVLTPNVPLSACQDAAAADPPAGPNPWYNLEGWKNSVRSQIGSDPGGKPLDPSGVSNTLSNIDVEISNVMQHVSALSSDAQAKLKPQVDIVNQNQMALRARTDLLGWIAQLKKNDPQSYPLMDVSQSGSDWIQATWNLNATNTAAAVAKRLATVPYKPAQAGDLILSPAPKQSLVAVTVQYQSTPRLEFSTGLMVPTLPFHSYAVAATAINGTITGNVVQESKTFTVVPLALVNVSVWQGIAGRQPVAGFLSLGTGYNPATSNVEFGVGGSFSWKSLQFGALADIGRDLQLAGGFTVGETLPASNPPKPLTTTVWGVKPAFSLSVRIPITGASK